MTLWDIKDLWSLQTRIAKRFASELGERESSFDQFGVDPGSNPGRGAFRSEEEKKSKKEVAEFRIQL